jgi:WD40 repeat protein
MTLEEENFTSQQQTYLCPIVESGSLLAWAAGKYLVVYCRDTQKFQLDVLPEDHHHTEAIRSISFNKQSDKIATAGDDKTVMIWTRDAAESNWKRSFTYMHSKKIMTVHFDSNNVIFGDKFGEFFNLSLSSGEPAKLLFGHLAAVSASSFSDKRRLLISADRDEKIRITNYPHVWNIESFLFGHRKYVCALCWFDHDTQTRLVSAGADGQVILWDISNESSPRIVWSVSLADGGPINSLCVDETKRIVLVLRSQFPSEIIAITEEGVISEQIIHLTEPAQSIRATHDGNIVAVTFKSHLASVGGETIRISKDVEGVPVSLMKIIHHENFDESSRKRPKP